MKSIRARRWAIVVAALSAVAVSLCSGCSGGGQGGSSSAGDVGAGTVSDGSIADTGGGSDAALADTAPADAASTDGSAAADDAKATQDGAAGVDSAAEDIAAADTGPVGCPKKCTADQICKAGVCEDVIQPCGGPCSTGTFCDEAANGGKGQCVSSSCTLPTTWAKNTHKLSMFQIGQSSQGCDLDDDGKPDNVLGNILKLYPAVNTELDKSINDGLFNMLLEAPGFNDKGNEFKIVGLIAEIDPSNPKCSMTSPWANCKFTVDDDNYLGGPPGTPCPPQVLFKPAKVKAGELTAGAKAGKASAGQKVVITLPTAVPLKVTLSQVSLHGYPKLDAGAWKETKNGKLCGVITQKDFDKAIQSVPDDAWKTLALTKEQVIVIINATLKPDIDTNGDGFADAISVAMLFETVPAQVSKMTF